MNLIQQLLILSVAVPKTLPDNLNLLKNGVLDPKKWNVSQDDDEDTLSENSTHEKDKQK